MTSRVSEVISAMTRDVNCLADPSKSTRKRALVKLHRHVFEANQKLDAQDLLQVFGVLFKPVLKIYADEMEKCRELGIEMLSRFVEGGELQSSILLPYIIPVYSTRIGQEKVSEPSEEIRKALVEQLLLLCRTYDQEMKMFVDDVVRIVARTLEDPFHDIKKASCEVIVQISAACPEQFHYTSSLLSQPLLHSLSHQRSKVRISAIRACGNTICHGHREALENFRSALARRTLDDNPSVRKTMIDVAGILMCEDKDRYSHWQYLLPLLLIGEADDVPEIQELAFTKFQEAGKKFEEENRESMKDSLDYISEVESPHGNTQHTLFKPFPSLGVGCCELVHQNFSKLAPGIANDLTDWTASNRRQAARLLKVMMHYERHNCTMHLEKLMDALCSSCRDEESEVASLVQDTCQLVGVYCPASVWLETLAPRLESQGIQPHIRAAQLCVLEQCLKGSKSSQLESLLQQLMSALCNPDTCQSHDKSVQYYLLQCLTALFDIVQDKCSQVSGQIFEVIMNLTPIAQEHPDKAHEALESLAKCQEISLEELFMNHTRSFLTKLFEATPPASWSKHTHEARVLGEILTSAGPALDSVSDLIVSAYNDCCNPEKDVELRASLLTTLGKAVMNSSQGLNSDGTLKSHGLSLILDTLAPNTVWQAGEKAAGIRLAALSCIWAVLKQQILESADLIKVFEAVKPQLSASMEDHLADTRRVACQILTMILSQIPQYFNESTEAYDRLHALYPDLLKRLDDNNDDVRLIVCRTFKAYASCMTSSESLPYDQGLYGAHIREIVKVLLLHIDDQNLAIQERLLEVFEILATAHASLIKEAAENALTKNRHKEPCEKVINMCNQQLN